MKFSRGLSARIAVAAAGSLVLAGAAGTAFAEEFGNEDVDVNVEIAPLEEPGTLSLSVDGTSSPLSEVASGDAEIRQFDGALPVVTVTDTRAPEEVPEGAFWYVLGQASEFVGDAGQDPLAPGHLGWVPELVGDEGDGIVEAGQEIETILDEGVDNPAIGLVEGEFLYLADTAAARDGGTNSWSATAGLTLKTPLDVAPGSYSSTLTLSLFEE